MVANRSGQVMLHYLQLAQVMEDLAHNNRATWKVESGSIKSIVMEH